MWALKALYFLFANLPLEWNIFIILWNQNEIKLQIWNWISENEIALSHICTLRMKKNKKRLEILTTSIPRHIGCTTGLPQFSSEQQKKDGNYCHIQKWGFNTAKKVSKYIWIEDATSLQKFFTECFWNQVFV